MRVWKAILLSFCVMILGISLTFTFYQFYSIIDVRSLNISMNVVESANLGISGDTDKLDFGILSSSATSHKKTKVENYREEPVRVLVSVVGNVSPFIYLPENNIILYKNESKMVSVIADPRSAKLGHYEGYAIFVFKRM